MNSSPMHPATLDVTNCDREPIHIPGAIQSHGILLALQEPDLRIVQVSENIRAILGLDAADVLNTSVENVVGPAAFEVLEESLRVRRLDEVNPLALQIKRGDKLVPFDAVLHRSGPSLLVELEPAASELPVTFTSFFHNVRGSVSRLQEARAVADLCEIAVEEVSRLSGFDRVMVYRFDADWHGEVVAERCHPELDPFLGLHFPASDIPRQARELYRRNLMRFIRDVDYVPARVVPVENPITGAPLDLSLSVLRAISPIHIQYLKNMNVGASMTISLMRNDELWGLIACHHRTAKAVTVQTRMACEFLGRTVSLQLAAKEENEGFEYRMLLKSVQGHLLESMAREQPLGPALAETNPNLLKLVRAEGAAIRADGRIVSAGTVPGEADVLAIIEWLQENAREQEVFATDALAQLAPQFERLADTASGVLAIPLSRAHGNYIVWFRPEVVRTVRWGGDPNKAVNVESGRLAPRSSFDAWKEVVSLRARPWETFEIEAATELRRLIGSIIVRRAEELEATNLELARSNTELDSFAHIASHDLKEPLRGIHNYASYLVEDYSSVLDDDGRDKLETLVRLTQRMEDLIESLLQLSRVGRVDFADARVDLTEIAEEVVELYRPRLEERRVTVTISPLPSARCDRIRVREVFINLIGNAIKYNDSEQKRIEIFAPPPGDVRIGSPSAGAPIVPGLFVTVAVRDNGIGIREKHLETIFQMFKRLHARDGYGGGTGAGLAIARRIVERHGGAIWAQSDYGSGTSFYFTLPAS